MKTGVRYLNGVAVSNDAAAIIIANEELVAKIEELLSNILKAAESKDGNRD